MKDKFPLLLVLLFCIILQNEQSNTYTFRFDDLISCDSTHFVMQKNVFLSASLQLRLAIWVDLKSATSSRWIGKTDNLPASSISHMVEYCKRKEAPVADPSFYFERIIFLIYINRCADVRR